MELDLDELSDVEGPPVDEGGEAVGDAVEEAGEEVDMEDDVSGDEESDKVVTSEGSRKRKALALTSDEEESGDDN